MKPADDPTINYKIFVQRGCDRCAAAYHEARKNEADPELDLLTRRLENGATAHDIGCGTGIPYAQTLAQQFTVTRVDSWSETIQHARANVQKGSFVHENIISVEFPAPSFNGALALY